MTTGFEVWFKKWNKELGEGYFISEELSREVWNAAYEAGKQASYQERKAHAPSIYDEAEQQVAKKIFKDLEICEGWYYPEGKPQNGLVFQMLDKDYQALKSKYLKGETNAKQ